MSQAREMAMPWAPNRRLYCAPGRVLVKMSLGEAPDQVPTARDVRAGALEAAFGIDGGRVDRVLRHFSGKVTVARVHGAAAARHMAGSRHRGFDDVEHATGLARTFRVHLERGTRVDDLVDALRQVGTVDGASPLYLTLQEMAAVAAPPRPRHAEAQPAPGTGWGSRDRIGLREALAMEAGDETLIVAVVDTGVSGVHPELRRRLRAGYDTVQIGARDVAQGVSLVGDLTREDPEPDDEVGHGTACAAIIGGRGDRLPPGVAGLSWVLPMRVLGSARMPGRDAPVGIGSISDIDDGMKRAVDLGAAVINMSFGTPVAALDPHDAVPHLDVVKYALARGCVLVAASGNSGKREPIVPAALEGVIAVGALGQDGGPTHFSTSGDHVALSAPGEKVVSAGLDGSYQAVTGTSFAAPFVTGAAALLVSRARRRSTSVDAPTVLRVLRESARPWPPGTPQGHGAGTLDVAAALRRLDREIDDGGPPEQGAAVPTEPARRSER
jgi:subtilisin family serine protease